MRTRSEGRAELLAEMVKACVSENAQATKQFFRDNEAEVLAAAELLARTLHKGNKLLMCGNGGSAADSQHWAAEFVGTFSHLRPGLPAIALSSDSAAVTALGNDLGFDQIFARQIEALGAPGDVLIVITTSGNSRNILKAVKAAKQKKMAVLALAGKGGGALRKLAPDLLLVPSMSTPRVQEVQILIIHILCALVEARLFPGLSSSKSASDKTAGRSG